MRSSMLASIFLVMMGGVLCAEETLADFYWHGDRDEKKLALTIDDGPSVVTKRLLTFLEEKGIKATFFVLGSSVKSRPEALKSIVDKGHELGNHTYGHINFARYKKDDREEKLKKEILSAGELLKELTGADVRILRIPHGVTRKWIKKVAGGLDMTLVNWSFGVDWKKLTVEEMTVQYKNSVEPGAVLLFHDTTSKFEMRLEVMGEVIDHALEEGYEFVTVSEMFFKGSAERRVQSAE